MNRLDDGIYGKMKIESKAFPALIINGLFNLSVRIWIKHRVQCRIPYDDDDNLRVKPNMYWYRRIYYCIVYKMYSFRFTWAESFYARFKCKTPQTNETKRKETHKKNTRKKATMFYSHLSFVTTYNKQIHRKKDTNQCPNSWLSARWIHTYIFNL